MTQSAGESTALNVLFVRDLTGHSEPSKPKFHQRFLKSHKAEYESLFTGESDGSGAM
jgi:ketopantoate hydroxymethyltransferase